MIGVYQRSRSWQNVLANGIVPFIIVVLYHFNNGIIISNNLLVISYVACLAAITADKFSSELGVLAGRPFMLLTLRRVREGTSGGVTPSGIGAGLLGSLLIALLLISNPAN